MKRLIVGLLFSLLISISVYGQVGTFTFSSAFIFNLFQTVREVVGGVTLTISSPGSDVDNADWGGWGGTSGEAVCNEGGVAPSMTLSFDKPVTITSLRIADANGHTTEDWTFTTSRGSQIATVPSDDGTLVNFEANFVNIDYITITRTLGGDTFFLIDDVVLQSILPVELTAFSASVVNCVPRLNWRTTTEHDNAAFEIERNQIAGPIGVSSAWATIGSIQGAGTSNVPQEYSFADRKLASGTYEYRLKQIDHDGIFSYSSVVEAVAIAQPELYQLLQNFPNPFNPSTTIGFSLPYQSRVVLKVYDNIGREVRVLVEKELSAGDYTETFDAASLPGGAYYYRLTALSEKNGRTLTFRDSKRLLLLK